MRFALLAFESDLIFARMNSESCSVTADQPRYHFGKMYKVNIYY